TIGFGKVAPGVAALQGLLAETQGGGAGGRADDLRFYQMRDWIEQILGILGDKADIDDINDALLALYEDGYFRNLTATESMNIPSEAA
ncbi:hypothetical protein LCGC14_3143460, partial [marine sediment metagenome]